MEPLTIGLICYFCYSGIVMTVGTAINVVGCLSTQKEKTEKDKWKRKYSVTKCSRDDVKSFVEWFQGMMVSDNVMEGVDGLLETPCTIPTLNQPFEYRGVVITLVFANNNYAVALSADSQRAISTFWENIS